MRVEPSMNPKPVDACPTADADRALARMPHPSEAANDTTTHGKGAQHRIQVVEEVQKVRNAPMATTG